MDFSPATARFPPWRRLFSPGAAAKTRGQAGWIGDLRGKHSLPLTTGGSPERPGANARGQRAAAAPHMDRELGRTSLASIPPL